MASQTKPIYRLSRPVLVRHCGLFGHADYTKAHATTSGLLAVMAGLLSLEYGPALPLRLPNHLDKSAHITVSTPHVINRQTYGEHSCSYSSDCDDGVSNEQS